jgi:hypothetical protein
MRSLARVACAVVLAFPPAAGADQPAKSAATGLTTAQAEALVREMSATVERLRRLKLKTPVAVEVVDRAAAREDFESDLDDEERETARHTRDAWVAIGLVSADTDLVKAHLETADKDVAGYYKSGSKTFRLLSDVSELELRSVMAHELTHALEDQYYDLQSVHRRATNDDEAVAIRAVIEGSATVTTLEILRRQGGIGKAREEAALASQARARRVRQAPTFVQMQLLLPYTLGFSFLLRGKPWELLFDGVRIEDIERAYADPPLSTREILHPEQYWGARRGHRNALSLPDMSKLLGPGWSLAVSGSIGELGLTLLTGSRIQTGGFEMLLPTRWTTPGAAGTAGDVYQHYLDGERTVTVLLTRWESVRDADEFQRTLRPGRRKLYRFGANLLFLMGDFGDRGQALAAEAASSVKYWAGE